MVAAFPVAMATAAIWATGDIVAPAPDPGKGGLTLDLLMLQCRFLCFPGNAIDAATLGRAAGTVHRIIDATMAPAQIATCTGI